MQSALSLEVSAPRWDEVCGVQVPSFTLPSNLGLTFFIYIVFLHMSFEEKVTSAAKRVHLENHGSRTVIPNPTELFQLMFTSLAPPLLLKCWRLLPRGGWWCPGDRNLAPAHLFPSAAHKAQPRPSVLPTPWRNARAGVQSHKNHKHGRSETLLGKVFPEKVKEPFWNLPWFAD